jgi:hypothetical protein
MSKVLDPVDRETIVVTLRQLEHKPGVNSSDWYKVHDNLIILAAFTLVYAKENYLPLIITSIIRPKIKGVSKTDIHSKGRAFDISIRGWTKEQILNFVKKINEEFKIGAISVTDGKEREAVWEDGITAGKGPHLHIQCRP